ncbi:MAG: triose-phosphate isomerase, partial [Prevotella sp.]|nr:triose-phosphate isomerase [Prevotella sp.]
MRKTVVNICRLLLAVVFILSGFVKAVDPVGTQYKLEDYLEALHLGGFVPELALLAVAVVLSAVEFCLGIFLLFAMRRRSATVLTLVLMCIMTPLTLWLALADPISDCGCFGDAVVLTNWQTFAKNVVLLGAAVVVARWHKDMFRFVSETNQWIAINYSVLFILAVSALCLYDLPLFDFRPYHIGTDLRKGWNEMIEGKESPYTDFFIERSTDRSDITEDVLNDTSYVFLLVSPHLEVADDSRLDLINELYEYATEHGYSFYGLTASNEKAIAHWRDITGADYEFCLTDETTLRTIIRSNPGLLLLKNGVVIRKWSHNNLPEIDEGFAAAPLSTMEIGQMPGDSVPRKITSILMWFVLPLVLLSIADRTWMWTKWLKKKQTNVQTPIKSIINIFNPFNKNKVKMRKKIVAGNWKMNMNLQDGIALAKELNETLKAEKPNCGVVICTPFIHLASIAQFLDQNIIGLGAENCADKEKGAFTGEVSAEMVKSTGAQYVILGHSERREYYKETPEILKEKVLLAQKNDLKVIFCIGESLAEREAGKQNEVVKAELEGSVFNLSEEDFRKIVITYEPIWAIGTGKTATAEQAEEIHAYIRSIIAEKYGQAVADDTTILYGGSCKASNAPEL